MKICSKCAIPQEDSQFKKHSLICKSCVTEYNKLYEVLNKEKRKAKKKDWYELNKEKVFKYNKNNPNKSVIKRKYRETHKTEIKEYCETHKEDTSLSNKQYREAHKAELKEYREAHKAELKEYREIHKVELNEKSKLYQKKRRKNDPLFKLSSNIRCSIFSSFKNKGKRKKLKSEEILGCSFNEFKLYLESKFEPWMNWDNRGKYNGEFNYGWDIDHIIPLCSAKTEEDIIKLNHYTNLQPLCSYINRNIKRDK